MTNEEARQWFLKVYSEIKGKGYADENEEAYELAIKALEQEPCRDMEEIREVVGCDVDVETKCKMISNILTAKPHYFVEQEPCDDVVSRDMALEKMADYVASGYADSVEDFEEYSRIICQLPSVRPQEQTEKCRTCKYGEIYNDLWCKCNDPLLNGVMVKMTDQCRAEEIIDLNRKYKAEREKKE